MAQMKERIIFEPSEEVLKLWSEATAIIPSDAEIKRQAAIMRQPWGLVKKNILAKAAKRTPEYLTGWSQGKLDRKNSQPFHRDGNGAHYMKGYHDGYVGS